jgi:hypothetical protein
MFDERRLYIKQLLRNYKKSITDTPMSYTIRLTHSDGSNEDRLIAHNEGIDFVIQYIDELEHKVDELQYVERIINAAKEK